MRRTYFLDSRFFIGVANIAFNAILIQDLISNLTFSPPSELVFVGLIAITALSIGFASYLLERDPGGSGFLELRAFLSKPPRQFLAYVTVVTGWAISGFLFQPWSLIQTLNEEPAFYYAYQLWFLCFSSVLLCAFIGMPVATIYRQGRSLSDSKAARSLKTISFSWAGFGVVSLFQVAIPTVQEIGVVAESLLFVMVAFALKEPTVLGRIISVPSAARRSVYLFPGTDTIVLYNDDSERRKILESFAREEWRNHRKASCLVARSETPFYVAILNRIQVDIPKADGGGVSVLAIEDLMQRIHGGGLRLTARSENQLIDLGGLDEARSLTLIQNSREVAGNQGALDRSRIWVINDERADPRILALIRDLNPRNKTIDQASRRDSFSAMVGLEHRGINGSKLLLEFDPSSPFENCVEKFVKEFQANAQPVAVFTSIGSPVRERLGSQQDVSLFSFSSKTSTPSRGRGEEVLLPERDSSLLLDAVDKFLQANKGREVALALDVFTDLVLLQGFEKAYGVLSSIMEMTESESATTLVALNYTALDEKVLSGVRGLFVSHILCDLNELRLVRFQESKLREEPEDDRSLLDMTASRRVSGR